VRCKSDKGGRNCPGGLGGVAVLCLHMMQATAAVTDTLSTAHGCHSPALHTSGLTISIQQLVPGVGQPLLQVGGAGGGRSSRVPALPVVWGGGRGSTRGFVGKKIGKRVY
jgi:hypothetical protein